MLVPLLVKYKQYEMVIEFLLIRYNRITAWETKPWRKSRSKLHGSLSKQESTINKKKKYKEKRTEKKAGEIVERKIV